MKKQSFVIKLHIASNVSAQELIKIGNWEFEEQIIDNRKALVGLTEIKVMEDEITENMPNNEVLSKVRDSVQLPLVALSFCLDGVFRSDPQNLEVISKKDNRTSKVSYNDFSHATFGRSVSSQECAYAENLTKALKKDTFLVKVFGYYQSGLLLSHGLYYPTETFLNFYKAIEMISQEICRTHAHELKSEKETELDAIASKILNERKLDNPRHSPQIKINQVKNLIKKYIQQREISAIDQITFACVKLTLRKDETTVKRLVKIRNQGGIAHSSKQPDKWLTEIKQCRDLARKFILMFLVSKNVIGQKSFEELMKVQSAYM